MCGTILRIWKTVVFNVVLLPWFLCFTWVLFDSGMCPCERLQWFLVSRCTPNYCYVSRPIGHLRWHCCHWDCYNVQVVGWELVTTSPTFSLVVKQTVHWKAAHPSPFIFPISENDRPTYWLLQHTSLPTFFSVIEDGLGWEDYQWLTRQWRYCCWAFT